MEKVSFDAASRTPVSASGRASQDHHLFSSSRSVLNTFRIFERAAPRGRLFHARTVRCRSMRRAFQVLAITSIAMLTLYCAMVAYDIKMGPGPDSTHAFVGPTRTYSMWYWNGQENFQSVRFFSGEHPNLRHVSFEGEYGYPHYFCGCRYEEGFTTWGGYMAVQNPVFVRTLIVRAWMIVVLLLLLPLAWAGTLLRSYMIRKSARRGFPMSVSQESDIKSIKTLPAGASASH